VTAAAPAWVVTFLLTDVESSTSRWEADAEGMRSALAAHDEVLRSFDRDAVGFLLKRTGDGICMAINSPEYVVDAAVALK
jgi:class 3 adenylate cyclase